MFVNNDKILGFLQSTYSYKEFSDLKQVLIDNSVLLFPTISDTGLFSASRESNDICRTRYDRVWVRDNIFIAHAHLMVGEVEIAGRALKSLFTMFHSQIDRFRIYIDGVAEKRDLTQRPHVRFIAYNRSTFKFEPWNAQNDALGYFLWLACRMITSGDYSASAEDIELLKSFVAFFQAVEFWRDEDCGHWEEEPKVQASSIGAVLAGLYSFVGLVSRKNLSLNSHETAVLSTLCERGRAALKHILPNECIQQGNRRESDAALLFLIYPLSIIDDKTAEDIIGRVENTLKGDYGVKRYRGDLFWGPDFETIVPSDKWTEDTTANPEDRRSLVTIRDGVDEAQWCIFDSIFSVIFGTMFKKGCHEMLNRQIHYLNRALGQITGDDAGDVSYRCPELYYRKGGRYVHNNATPLMWAQANLLCALKCLEENIVSM